MLSVTPSIAARRSASRRAFAVLAAVMVAFATLVSTEGRELDHFQRFVRPQRRPCLTTFCRELTHITQANVDQMKSSQDPVVQRILGVSEDTGKLLGLDRDWMGRAIKAVGNYGEIFERNVGPKSPLKLPRGANNLWNKGGLMYAPPVR
mgnify:CR=1 FL=1